MLYDIRLELALHYAGQAGNIRHVARLVPAGIPGVQRPLRVDLQAVPAAASRDEHVDFFGNRVVEFTFAQPLETLTYELVARIERTGTAPRGDSAPDLPGLKTELDACRDVRAASPLHFLSPSPMVSPSRAVAAYVAGIVEPGASVFSTALALNSALHRDMRYDPEATEVDTPLDEAFAARHGVCQDFAHIMIAGLRHAGIPAAYVSGFLRTVPPPGRERLEGADAMHAWVAAWCGRETGWVGFDPTNALVVAGDHIVVARGRDYGDVVPVAGMMRAAGGQEITQAVDVIALDEEGHSRRAAS